jgi:hypothetical protein
MERQMRCHDLRMALVALVVFGPVVLAAAYGAAHASRLDPVAPTVAAPLAVSAPAPEQPVAAKFASPSHKPKKFVSASIDQVRPKHRKAPIVQ